MAAWYSRTRVDNHPQRVNPFAEAFKQLTRKSPSAWRSSIHDWYGLGGDQLVGRWQRGNSPSQIGCERAHYFRNGKSTTLHLSIFSCCKFINTFLWYREPTNNSLHKQRILAVITLWRSCGSARRFEHTYRHICSLVFQGSRGKTTNPTRPTRGATTYEGFLLETVYLTSGTIALTNKPSLFVNILTSSQMLLQSFFM